MLTSKRGIAAGILATFLAYGLFAQSFELSWHTIDAGGDLFTAGGAFEVSGTIAQPDAGPTLTGGSFALAGGFWPAARQPCVGDVNGDSVIDLSDLTALLAAFGSCAGGAAFNVAADFDGSGCIDLADLTLLLGRFGTTCS